MIYEIVFTSEALEDIEKLKKTGNKALLKKLYSLIKYSLKSKWGLL